MSKHYASSLLVAVAGCCTLAACGGSSETSTPVVVVPPLVVPAALAIAPDDLFSRPANAIVVVSTVDDARASSATIGRSGGSLTTTGADGSRFTLSVPANSLAEDTVITMTPITGTTGAPWTRAVGARFTPSGLRFHQLATLQIDPPATFDVPVTEQAMLGAGDEGEIFFATPDPGATPRIRVAHFTDYWFGQLTAEQLAAARLRLPRLAELQLESEIAAALTAERARQLAGATDPDPNGVAFSALFGKVMKQYLEEVLEPRIVAARTCADYKAILSALFTLERQRELLGASQGSEHLFTGESLDAGFAFFVRDFVPFGNIAKAAQFTCFKEASERCVMRNHLDLAQFTAQQDRLSALLTEFQAADSDFGRTYLRYGERFDACYRFDVQFDSTLIVANVPGAVSATSTVTSRINDLRPLAGLVSAIPFFAEFNPVVKSAALVNTSVDIEAPACGNLSNVARGGSTLSTNLVFSTGANNKADHLKITIGLGNTGESWTLTGCGAGSVRYGPQPLWTDAFLATHEAVRFEQTGLGRGVSLTFRNPEPKDASGAFPPSALPLNGATVLDKTWKQVVGNVQETTTLKVIHKPVAMVELALPPPAP